MDKLIYKLIKEYNDIFKRIRNNDKDIKVVVLCFKERNTNNKNSSSISYNKVNNLWKNYMLMLFSLFFFFC